MTMKTTKRLKATTALASTTTPIVNAPTGNIVYCLCVCVCVCVHWCASKCLFISLQLQIMTS